MIDQSNGGFLIGKVKQIQGRVFEKLLAEYGIDQFNGAQGRILFVLWDGDGIPIRELSDKTGLAKTTLTGMLDRMEAADMVARAPDKRNRRQILVSITDRARGYQRDYDRVSELMNAQFYKGFSEAEVVSFEETLKRIIHNFEETGV